MDIVVTWGCRWFRLLQSSWNLLFSECMRKTLVWHLLQKSSDLHTNLAFELLVVRCFSNLNEMSSNGIGADWRMCWLGWLLSSTKLAYQINEVWQQLLLKLEEKSEADEDALLFEKSGIRYNRFHLSCSDAESYAWLKETVDSMEIHGGNQDEKLRLQLVAPAEVPKLLRAEVYISGPPRGVPRFIRLFKVQNKLMHTDRWVLRHQQQTEKQQLMVWGIDQESATALAAVNYRPHCGLGRVTLRVSHDQSSVGGDW